MQGAASVAMGHGHSSLRLRTVGDTPTPALPRGLGLGVEISSGVDSFRVHLNDGSKVAHDFSGSADVGLRESATAKRLSKRPMAISATVMSGREGMPGGLLINRNVSRGANVEDR